MPVDIDNSISAKQMQVLWVQAKQLGLSSFHLHELAYELSGKKSLKALSSKHAATLIDLLQDAGARVTAKKRPRRNLPPDVVELPSPEQGRYIKYLEKQLGWQENPKRLKGFLKYTIKRERILTKADAVKVIEGLKSMTRQKRKEVNQKG
jgi:hypothetical protein